MFPKDKQHLRWSKFKNLEAQQMFDVVSKEVFPFIKIYMERKIRLMRNIWMMLFL